MSEPTGSKRQWGFYLDDMVAFAEYDEAAQFATGFMQINACRTSWFVATGTRWHRARIARLTRRDRTLCLRARRHWCVRPFVPDAAESPNGEPRLDASLRHVKAGLKLCWNGEACSKRQRPKGQAVRQPGERSVRAVAKGVLQMSPSALVDPGALFRMVTQTKRGLVE